MGGTGQRFPGPYFTACEGTHHHRLLGSRNAAPEPVSPQQVAYAELFREGESVFISLPGIALALAQPGGDQGPASQLGPSGGLCIEARPRLPRATSRDDYQRGCYLWSGLGNLGLAFRVITAVP